MMHFKAHGRSSQLAPELFHPNLLNRVGMSDSWTTGTEQLDRLTRWRPQEPVSLWHGSVSGRRGISAGGAWLALCTKGAGATFRATEEGEHPLTSRPVARWI